MLGAFAFPREDEVGSGSMSKRVDDRVLVLAVGPAEVVPGTAKLVVERAKTWQRPLEDGSGNDEDGSTNFPSHHDPGAGHVPPVGDEVDAIEIVTQLSEPGRRCLRIRQRTATRIERGQHHPNSRLLGTGLEQTNLFAVESVPRNDERKVASERETDRMIDPTSRSPVALVMRATEHHNN